MNSGQNTVTPRAVRREAAKSAPGDDRPPTPMHEMIERRAYEIWQQRGCRHGFDLRDWREAEDELKVARCFRHGKRR